MIPLLPGFSFHSDHSRNPRETSRHLVTIVHTRFGHFDCVMLGLSATMQHPGSCKSFWSKLVSLATFQWAQLSLSEETFSAICLDRVHGPFSSTSEGRLTLGFASSPMEASETPGIINAGGTSPRVADTSVWEMKFHNRDIILFTGDEISNISMSLMWSKTSISSVLSIFLVCLCTYFLIFQVFFLLKW